MVFLSASFFIFFAFVVMLHFILPPRFRWLLLLISSYAFYAYIDLRFPLWLLFITLSTHLSAHWMGQASRKRKWRLLLAIALPLGCLLYFKYLTFLVQSIHRLTHHGSSLSAEVLPTILLPLGISFYVFKSISYLIDVYRSQIEVENHFGRLALYISFFPQLLAGPIERYTAFRPQLLQERPFQTEDFRIGLKRFFWGLIKKAVVADNLARFVNQVFSDPGAYAGFTLLMSALFFSIQIYCDFSGYSDMAIGLARMLGFHTAENFDHPYYSRSIGEFWSRWHISLSLWLRDYLFLPLAYSYMRRMEKLDRLPLKLDAQAYIFSTLLTMLLAGLWHGANWTFVVWGGTIGLLLILSFLTRKIRRRTVRKIVPKRMKPIADGLRIIQTFVLVSFAWIFFRATSISDALGYLSRISLTTEAKGMGHIIFLSLLILTFLITDHIIKTFTPDSWIARVPLPVRTVGYALALCLFIILGVDHANEFLYFAF